MKTLLSKKIAIICLPCLTIPGLGGLGGEGEAHCLPAATPTTPETPEEEREQDYIPLQVWRREGEGLLSYMLPLPFTHLTCLFGKFCPALSPHLQTFLTSLPLFEALGWKWPFIHSLHDIAGEWEEESVTFPPPSLSLIWKVEGRKEGKGGLWENSILPSHLSLPLRLVILYPTVTVRSRESREWGTLPILETTPSPLFNLVIGGGKRQG